MDVLYDEGYAFVDGYKFRKDTKSGYYLSTKKIGVSRLRLHVYMWLKYNKEIPKGYEIHHKDENKDNNEIENLACLSKKEHLEWHGENVTNELKDKWCKNLDVHRHKANEWHKSKEGREWHKKHAAKTFSKDKLVYMDKTCEFCNTTYSTPREWSKFCSPNCQTKARKKSGIDNEIRQCAICEVEFAANKYSKKKTCSRECANRMISIARSKKSE